MKNREITAAWAYHDGTKHSYQSIRTNPHYLDWQIQPVPFKIYRDLEPIPLNQHLTSSGMAALDVIAVSSADAEAVASPTRQTLAEIFFLSAGVTKRRSYAGGEMLFRAAACTGALYHIDLYVVCGDLEDLEAGVYQFSPQDFSLRKLRAGDYRSVLVNASGEEPSIVNAPCVIVSASTFWRNAWKYQSRAYRHCYWDNGTILANLLAGSAARKVPAKVVLGFVDGALSDLLSLDRQREAPLSLVALGCTAKQSIRSFPAIEPLALETEPLSTREVEYPAMRSMHEASSLASAEEVASWRNEAQARGMKDESGNEPQGGRLKDESAERLFILQPFKDDEMPQDKIEEVIIRRGSTREFSRDAITFAQLSTMIDRATRGMPFDCLNAGESLNDLYLIVNAVDGLPPGAYVYPRKGRALELLKEGDFRRDAGYLGLGQAIPADCSVNVYFLADLHRVFERFGNRGYRAAQLEASIMGGKLYLAAYAQRLGASGLTFFDDDVIEFFSPHAAGKSVMFLIAIGKSVKLKG
jgi:SagB-type dehydrogenase family enzyme